MSTPYLLAAKAGELEQILDGLIADGRDTDLLDGVGELPSLVESLRADPADAADVGLAVWNAGATAAIALRRSKTGLFTGALDAMVETYRLGDVKAETPEPADASLFENTAAAVWALGAVTVQLERWEELRRLVVVQPVPDGYWATWLRHAQTMSARTTARGAGDDNIIDVAALRLATQTSFGMAELVEEQRFQMLCGFDFLALTVASTLVDDHLTGGTNFYPSFAKYPSEYMERQVYDLRDEDDPKRKSLYTGTNDELREMLRETNEMALHQAAQTRWRRDGGWAYSGFQDARTWAFIREGQIWEQWAGIRF